MNRFDFYPDEIAVPAIHDPFMEVEADANTQTGTDWYQLMLATAVGGVPVHGATLAATCETIAKQTESFADKHAVGRVHFKPNKRNCEHAGDEWYYANLTGRGFHGAKSTNKARMLFDSGEWEPSQHTRAKNAAFVGAILTANGLHPSSALEISSAIAGEPIPLDAVSRTELPMQVVKREAAAASKPNHIVYSHGNAHRGILWDDSQFHQGVLPETAAVDWSRVTTIARYVAEANVMVDEGYQHYANELGVPYSLVWGSWATVSTADYTLNPDHFGGIDTTVAQLLPTSALAGAYDNHAEGLYDAIHRTANEMALGVVDPSLEALLTAAERLRKKPGRTKLATGTYLLAEPTRHRYGAEAAADAVGTSSRSWDALTKSTSELVLSKRTLHHATTAAVLAAREGKPYENSLEPLLAEMCKSAIWVRACVYLGEMLHAVDAARVRMGRLKRTTLGNSAPLGVDVVLTTRIRAAATQPTLSLARRVIAGDIPKLQMPVDAKLAHKAPGVEEQRRFVNALAQHLDTTRKKWVERYHKLARAHAVRHSTGDMLRSIEFGSAAKAFECLTPYLASRADTGFVDPDNLGSSYLIAIARGYIRKRHIMHKDLGPVRGLDSKGQAACLDEILQPEVTFTHVEQFCNAKLSMFYNDIVAGLEPKFVGESPVEEETAVGMAEPDPAMLETLLMVLDAPIASRVSYESVVNTYESETLANRHAVANGYRDFLDAYEALGEGSRYDTESGYTIAGLNAQLAKEAEEVDEQAQPVL